jgi:Yip1 domain
MPPEDLLKPRAFFHDLRDRERNLFGPIRVSVIVVLLGNLIPVLFYEFQNKGAWFVRQVSLGLVAVIVLMALVRLIAGFGANVRAPEIVGYSLTPVLYALLVFGTLGFFVPVLGPLVMLVALGMSLYFVWVGVDELVGRAQAWRVVLIVPVLAVIVLYAFGALMGVPRA